MSTKEAVTALDLAARMPKPITALEAGMMGTLGAIAVGTALGSHRKKREQQAAGSAPHPSIVAHNKAWEDAMLHHETGGKQGTPWDHKKWGYEHPAIPGPSDKKASMIEHLTGQIDKTAFDRFQAVWDDRDFAPHVRKNPIVMELLTEAAEGANVIPPLRKEASVDHLSEDQILSDPHFAPHKGYADLHDLRKKYKGYVAGDKKHWAPSSHGLHSQLYSGKKASAGFNVIQIVPDGYGYRIKVSAAPKGVEKKETKVSKDDAKKAVPQEALDTADETGAATMTDVEADPDPLIEHPQPIEGFGQYKVFTADGKQILGWVVPGMFDPMSGTTSNMHLFINGGQYALQPEPFHGVLVGVSFNLPSSEVVRGLGVFHIATPQAVLVTLPYTVMGEVTVEGETHYAAQDQMGQEVQIVFSEGIKRPVAAGPGQLVIPADAKFLPLDNPIQAHSGMTDPMAAAKTAAAPTMLEIRAWDDGTCELSGPVVEKVGSGVHDWLDAAFYMACTGVPQEATMQLLKAACVKREAIRIYGLQTLTSAEDEAKTASVARRIQIDAMNVPAPVCLLREAVAISSTKEASSLVGAQTIDAVLALNFLTPDNVDSFVENLPLLEDASSKLAELSLATDLGLQSVPPYAVNRAMDCLEEVISGLKALKKYEV